MPQMMPMSWIIPSLIMVFMFVIMFINLSYTIKIYLPKKFILNIKKSEVWLW